MSPDLIDVRNTATRRGKGKKEKIEKMSESFALRSTVHYRYCTGTLVL